MMTHDCGNDIEPERHSFKIDFDEAEKHVKPLYPSKPPKEKAARVKLPDHYPKLEIEFFDVVKSCAEYIDKIDSKSERIKFTNELNKIFIIRHKPSVMRLFRELVNIQLTKKEVSNG